MSINNPKLTKQVPDLDKISSEIKKSLKGISIKNASLLLYEVEKELLSELII